MTTKRQKLALDFCHEQGLPRYIGDREDFSKVSEYLGKYLDSAKGRYKLSLEHDKLLQKEFEEQIVQENLGADYMG